MELTLPAIMEIPPKILPVVTQFNNYEYFLLEGGRGSGKSQSVGRFLLFLGEQRKIRVFCGREIQSSIEESVYALLTDLIGQYNLNYEVFAQKIVHRITGTTFRFKGFREQGNVNVKGLEGVDILWIDEAQSVTEDTLNVIIPTIRKENSKVFFSMNRFLREDAVPALLMGRKDCLHIHIDYFENPHCPLKLKNEAEICRQRSQKDYEHIWLGMPRAAASDYLFNFDKLYKSLETKPFGELYIRQRVIGIDMAAEGDDLCVATILDRASNQHWVVTEQISWDEPDTMVSVGKIVAMIGDHKPDLVILDKGGLGKGPFDRLNELDLGTPVYGFDGGSTQGIDTKAYGNIRAASYHTTKEWFDNEFLCIDGAKNKQIIKEAEKIKLIYRSNGVRMIQSKKDMKTDKQGLKISPDHMDSLNMAIWGAVTYLGKPANSSAGESSGRVVRKTGSSRGRR